MRQNVNIIDRDKVKLILDWCITEMGKSKYCKDYPRLYVYRSSGKYKYKEKVYREYGMKAEYNFESNRMPLFLGAIPSVRDLCYVIIHEYRHYLQNPIEYWRIRSRMLRDGFSVEYIDNNHPFEKEAHRIGSKLCDKCYNELKYKLYK